MRMVAKYGTMWARNTENIRKIPNVRAGGVGIYVLYDGSMPLYVGKGNIKHRVTDARRSKRRGQLWDRFSWYAVADPKMMHDLEVLLLRILPRYLRALTRQEGHFLKAQRIMQKDVVADAITRAGRKRLSDGQLASCPDG
jgi:hypothetical protein